MSFDKRGKTVLFESIYTLLPPIFSHITPFSSTYDLLHLGTVTKTNLHNSDLRRLENATRYAARIVTDLGDEYWPLFERLEREFRELQERETILRKFQ